MSTSLKTTARRLLTTSRLLAPPPAPEDPCPHCGAVGLVEPEDEHHVTLLDWTAEELLAPMAAAVLLTVSKRVTPRHLLRTPIRRRLMGW